MQSFLQQLGESISTSSLAMAPTSCSTVLKLVELDDGDTAHATGSRHREAFLQRLEHLAAM